MSGHSKWSTIKRAKGVTDARRSALFTKLARQISVAARLGGGDPTMNFRLRLAIDKAKAGNLPNDNIERAIKAGTGEGSEGHTKEVVYEGFGPGGAAIMVEAITDNSNRTAGEIRLAFTKHGGSLGAQKSVAWMFNLRGVIRISLADIKPEQVEEVELKCIDAGAEDVKEDGDHLLIITPGEQLHQAHQAVTASGFTAEAGVEFLPSTTVELTDEVRGKLHALLEALDELDDVTHVTTNEA